MNTNDLRHNIFGYATKELSQDAFIAWLLSYAYEGSENEDHDLWSCAQVFLRSFVGKADDTIFTVTDIKMQYHRIDVYVEMHDQHNEQYAVIVEDKVYSAHHDDQIYRYTEEIRKELNTTNSSNRKIHVVYFKSGHIEDSENIEINRLIEKRKLNLHIIPLETIVILLNSTTSNSDIFNMYKSYIVNMEEKRSHFRASATSDHFYSEDSKTNPLNNAYIQWCFLDNVFPVRKMEDDEEIRVAFEDWKKTHSNYRGDQPLFVQDYMYGGSSSGTPWTQYCFWEAVHEKTESEDDNRPKLHSLFWRLDPWQISLRYYVNSGIKEPEKDDKLSSFKALRPDIPGWTKVDRHATYEFSLLEHKFSPDEKLADLKAQILAIHQVFKNNLP